MPYGGQVNSARTNLLMKKRLFPLAFLLCAAMFATHGAFAQSLFPAPSSPQVKWSASLRPADARRGEGAQIVVSAQIPKGWHLYSTTTPKGGPLKTTLKIAPNSALVASGAPVQPKPHVKLDAGFKINVETYDGAVAFGLPVKLKANAPAKTQIALQVRSMICNATTCLPPRNEVVSLVVQPAKGAARANHAKPITQVPPQPPNAATTKSSDTSSSGATTSGAASTSDQNNATSSTRLAQTASGDNSNDIAGRVRRAQSNGIASFLLLAMTMGFAALLTPCVFPMIPITISVFSKPESGATKRDLRAPIAYCLGIIGTFTLIGLVVSAVFGASGITRLAANPVLNVAMATLFTVLALNLFGVFEIIVPSRILQRVQSQQGAQSSSRSRLVVPLLMGLTFTLTSFTCTVPFVGTLLVATSKGSAWWPLLGMLAFSSAFALPFFLLALFPQWLARLPKAGSWMVSVKATMGFLELAAALKFLSQADYVWNLGVLTRPVFLSLWSTLAIVAGFYLLRWLRLPHESSTQKPGLMRRALGIAFCAAGVYLLAGTGGQSLGILDAYPPPADYGSRVLSASAVQWHDDYEQAAARAKSQSKPLLINFTGYACTNCRVMESNVLPQPQVRRAIDNFVAVELYTDGEDAASKRNSKLQQQKFGTVALPLYVVVSPEGKELARLEGLNRDPQAFVDFLQRAQSSTRLAAR
jgi:thiol:disulfide interchange protein